MLLSIVMMVKNEEKNLEKCLSHLKPVLDNIDSELIILDTGSEDGTVSIAKQYTNKVYFEKWNNNFASMRNKSISYAKGQWIFIIDADEILEDPKDIISFFETGKMCKYKTGFINIKNYTSKNKYYTIYIARLFKKDKYFKYTGAIHEQPTIKKPIYFLNTPLIHFGYFSHDDDLMERKFTRNVEILERELKKDPMNIYYWYQLSQSYNAYKYKKEALKFAEKAYKIGRDRKLNFKNYMYIYTHLGLIYYQQGKYSQLEKLCYEAMEIQDGYIDIYYFLAKSSYELGKDKQAIKYYKKYLDLLPIYNKTQASKDITVTVYTLDIYEYVYGELCLTYNRQENYEKVLFYANKINEPNVIEQISQPIIKAFIQLKKYQELISYYDNKIKNISDNIRETFIQTLEEQLKSFEIKEKLLFIKYFSNESNNYGLLNKVRFALNNGQKLTYEEEKFLLEEINLNKSPAYYGDIVFYFLRQNRMMSEVIGNVRDDKLHEYFRYAYEQHLDDFTELGKKYITHSVGDQNYEEKKFIKCLCHFLLVSKDLDNEEYESIFNQYIMRGIDCIKEVYNSSIIENKRIADLKNDSEAFLLYIKHAIENRNQDITSYVTYLRKALNVYPEMKKGIEILMNGVKEENKENIPRSNNNSNEFEELKKSVKANINVLLDTEKTKEAKSLIDEYLKIVPYDLEMLTLKSEIHLRLM